MPETRRIPIALTPTFHHDIAYLKPERLYTPACFEILDEALFILERHPEYRYTVEQAWLLEQYWRQRPEKRTLLRRLAREGRLSMSPGLYAVPDMNLLDGESLYMQAKVGKAIVRETLGLDPRMCYIADSWGHHAQLPQILRQCGYAYYGFSRCMRRDVNVENFKWEGLDGSRLHVHWYAMGYAGAFFPNGRRQVNAQEQAWVGMCTEEIRKLDEGLRPYCGDDPRILPAGGDMMFPARKAPELVRAMRQEADMPPIAFATIEEAMDAIPWADKPVTGGEFESSQKGTFATNITIKQRNQRYTRMLTSMETLAAVRGAASGFLLAWKLLLKQQFHDIICGTICDEAMAECDRDYEALRIHLEETLDALSPAAEAPGWFNALPFARTETVRLDGADCRVHVPALGYAALSDAVKPEEEAPPALPLQYETPYYRATVDEAGYITALIEPSTGRDLVGTQKTHAGRSIPFGGLVMQIDNGDGWEEFETPPSYRREHGGYNYNIPDPYDRTEAGFARTVGPHMPSIESARVVRADAGSLILEQRGEMRFWITVVHFVTRITLRKDSPRIEYHTEFPVEAKGFRVRAAFPASVPHGSIRHQIPYGLLEREEGPQCVQQFVDLCAEAGLALLNRGLPAANIEEGILMTTLMRSVAMEYKCQSARSYQLGEQMALDYAIVPHAPDQDALLWTEAMAFNTPLLRTTLPEAPDAFGLEGAMLSALRPDGEKAFARVYEYLGKPTQAVLHVPARYRRYAWTDGLQQPLQEPQPIQDGRLIVPLGPWQVQGILLQP